MPWALRLGGCLRAGHRGYPLPHFPRRFLALSGWQPELLAPDRGKPVFPETGVGGGGATLGVHESQQIPNPVQGTTPQGLCYLSLRRQFRPRRV